MLTRCFGGQPAPGYAVGCGTKLYGGLGKVNQQGGLRRQLFCFFENVIEELLCEDGPGSAVPMNSVALNRPDQLPDALRDLFGHSLAS